MIKIPTALLAAFPPSAGLLLDRARWKTDNAMLREIAEADYGCEADEMMAELRLIRDRGIVPVPAPFMLREVLSLTHWANPEVPEAPPFKPGPTARHGHQTRLFACAVLLQIEAETEESNISADSALAQGLASAKVLGDELSEAAACFLTWRTSQRASWSDRSVFALGLLILAIRLRRGRFEEADLGAISRWVLEIEAGQRSEFPQGFGGPMPAPFSIQQGLWEPLAAELRDGLNSIRDGDVHCDLELCGLLLDPGW